MARARDHSTRRDGVWRWPVSRCGRWRAADRPGDRPRRQARTDKALHDDHKPYHAVYRPPYPGLDYRAARPFARWAGRTCSPPCANGWARTRRGWAGNPRAGRTAPARQRRGSRGAGEGGGQGHPCRLICLFRQRAGAHRLAAACPDGAGEGLSCGLAGMVGCRTARRHGLRHLRDGYVAIRALDQPLRRLRRLHDQAARTAFHGAPAVLARRARDAGAWDRTAVQPVPAADQGAASARDLRGWETRLHHALATVVPRVGGDTVDGRRSLAPARAANAAVGQAARRWYEAAALCYTSASIDGQSLTARSENAPGLRPRDLNHVRNRPMAPAGATCTR